MKLSSKTCYGLRILLHVAQKSQVGRLVRGHELARKQRINEPYLEQIMISLKKAGLVQTVRGRHGGYRMTRDPASVSVLDIIEAFEGELILNDRREMNTDLANPSDDDFVDDVWEDLTKTIRVAATETTLAIIMERSMTGQPEYMI